MSGFGTLNLCFLTLQTITQQRKNIFAASHSAIGAKSELVKKNTAVSHKPIELNSVFTKTSYFIFFTTITIWTNITTPAYADILSENSLYANLSKSAYNDQLYEGKQGDLNVDGTSVQVIGHVPNGSFGFQAIAFEVDNKIIISFRGTDLSQPADLVTDIWALWATNESRVSKQYSAAISFVEEIKSAYPSADIEFTGHSLGGSIAQYVGIIYDKPTVTFNSAPIFSDSFDFYNLSAEEIVERSEDILNIRQVDDPVSYKFGGVTNSVGDNRFVNTQYTKDCGGSLTCRHTINAFQGTPYINDEESTANSNNNPVYGQGSIDYPDNNILPYDLSNLESDFDFTSFGQYQYLVPINQNTSGQGATNEGSIYETLDFISAPTTDHTDIVNEQIATLIDENDPDTTPPPDVISEEEWNGFLAAKVDGSSHLYTRSGVVINGDSSNPPSTGQNTFTTNGLSPGITTGTTKGNYIYTAWGQWNGSGVTIDSQPIEQAKIVIGRLTQPADMPSSGTRNFGGASHNSEVAGIGFNGEQIAGTISLEADFSNGHVGGQFDFTADGNQWVNGTISNTPIQGNRFFGNDNMNINQGGSGNLGGAFYGDSAQEVAGEWAIWDVPGAIGGADGVFRAKQ